MKIGESSATAWDNTQNILLTMGQIKAKREPKDYFTNEFLP
jgi:hypothetical protein